MATKIIRAGKTLGTTAATSQKGIERAIVRAVLYAGFRARGPMDRALSTRDEYAVRLDDGTYQVRGLTGTRREPRGYVLIADRITLT
jgi:hypothetical protein